MSRIRLSRKLKMWRNEPWRTAVVKGGLRVFRAKLAISAKLRAGQRPPALSRKMIEDSLDNIEIKKIIHF